MLFLLTISQDSLQRGARSPGDSSGTQAAVSGVAPSSDGHLLAGRTAAGTPRHLPHTLQEATEHPLKAGPLQLRQLAASSAISPVGSPLCPGMPLKYFDHSYTVMAPPEVVCSGEKPWRGL